MASFLGTKMNFIIFVGIMTFVIIMLLIILAKNKMQVKRLRAEEDLAEMEAKKLQDDENKRASIIEDSLEAILAVKNSDFYRLLIAFSALLEEAYQKYSKLKKWPSGEDFLDIVSTSVRELDSNLLFSNEGWEKWASPFLKRFDTGLNKRGDSKCFAELCKLLNECRKAYTSTTFREPKRALNEIKVEIHKYNTLSLNGKIDFLEILQEAEKSSSCNSEES